MVPEPPRICAAVAAAAGAFRAAGLGTAARSRAPAAAATAAQIENFCKILAEIWHFEKKCTKNCRYDNSIIASPDDSTNVRSQ